jgi:hypothetical protein
MIKQRKSELGASMIEMGLLIALVSMVGLTAVPNVTRKTDCNLFLTGLALMDPTVHHPDGSRTANFVIPQSCAIIHLGFDPGPDGVRFESTDPSGFDSGKFTMSLMDGSIVIQGSNARPKQS